MELIISGYGEAGNENIIKCDEYGKIIWSDTIESPSFVTLSGDKLFTVTECEDHSVIYSYVKEGDGYKKTDSITFDGSFLCHVCYSEKNSMVFGACWGSGHLIYATLDKNGKFQNGRSVLQVNESGDEELLTRVHFVSTNKAEDTLMVNNVGLDVIYFYSISNGAIFEKDRIYTKKGQHPRHSVFNNDESILYVVTELSNEVLVYKMPDKQLVQSISTLPDGYAGKSHCSAICLSKDEKFIYCANRYSESIVCFAVDRNGLLSTVGYIPTDGRKPRHMILSSDGKKLVVCYQVSGEVCIYPIDENGMPSPEKSHSFNHASAAGVAEIV